VANVLEVEGLGVRFGREPVLRDLGFRIPPGATLAVIGPNGSGKTVLFRALVGAIPHRGRIAWASGTTFGYVPQRLDVERDLPLSGLDLLGARAGLAGLPAASLARTLAAVGLDRDVATRPIGALSGGQFHLLLFALALLGNPSVLLLDEATAGVDEPGQQRLRELLRRLQAERGTTVLVISHDIAVVTGQATHVLCLGRQRAWFGAPREVITPETLADLYGFPVSLHEHR
jgi:zinc transport system ATP-binding protein